MKRHTILIAHTAKGTTSGSSNNRNQWGPIMSLSIPARLLSCILAAGGILAANARAQDQKAMLIQQLAVLKESLAKNQQALRQYSWTENHAAEPQRRREGSQPERVSRWPRWPGVQDAAWRSRSGIERKEEAEDKG